MFKRGDDECVHLLLDHLFAERKGNMIELECDDYRPADDEKWGVDAWEERKGYISVPANRDGWAFGYRLARALIRHGQTTVLPQGLTVTLPCEVSIS